MKAIFFTDGIEAPASRYRCEQFFPYFVREGIEPTLSYAYGRSYNRLHQTRVGSPYKLGMRLKRAARQILLPFSDFDVAVLQRTALPQSALPERFASWVDTVPQIFDFDDSLHLGPGGRSSPTRLRAFRGAVEAADHLVAGNRWLADFADVPDKTTIIPTVIDTSRYVPGPRLDDDVVIGWMGTSGNFPYLAEIVPALTTVLRRHPNVRVRIVSNATFHPMQGVPRCEQIRWSAESEVELLQSFDIGVMPLKDQPVTRGKCAFKMIQYMAVGSPVVVSEVGANVEVAEGSDLGILLDSWKLGADALSELIEDPDERRRLGEAGRERAVARYSVEAALPEWLSLLRRFAR